MFQKKGGGQNHVLFHLPLFGQNQKLSGHSKTQNKHIMFISERPYFLFWQKKDCPALLFQHEKGNNLGSVCLPDYIPI